MPPVPCRRSTFHSRFVYLKEKLDLTGFMRKTQIDSLLKKCKSKTFKVIREALKRCLTYKFDRLPQSFITNIKIEYNKKYLDRTILDIYKEFGIITSLNDLMEKGLVRPGKLDVLNEFLNMKVRHVFESYMCSKQFSKEFRSIKEKEGDKFAVLYGFICRIFVNYYTYSKGNKPKKLERRIRFVKITDGVEKVKPKIFKIIRVEDNSTQ
jgi:hypothetical protein